MKKGGRDTRQQPIALSASVGSTDAAKDVVARFGRIDRCIQKVIRRPMCRVRWPSSTRER
jgi:hypothetical protein